MNRKRKVSSIILLLGMLISIIVPVAEARNIGSFSNFWVYRYGNQKTGYLTKTVHNGWYVVNLGATARGTTVIHQLVDTYNNGKSEWNRTESGTSNNYYTIDCNAGGNYAVQMHLENKDSDNLYGSWSPDHY